MSHAWDSRKTRLAVRYFEHQELVGGPEVLIVERGDSKMVLLIDVDAEKASRHQ